MDQVNRKRKYHEDIRQPSKFRKTESKPSRPSLSHGLPPLPAVSEEYQKRVFTHPSQTPGKPGDSYDRLEFLGDAYIELYASQLIYERFPDLEVGRLSQIRETLVKNETIGQYASLYGLDKQLNNYKLFQNGSPSVWLKIKGDIFEAHVAAVVLSNPGGAEAAKNWLRQLWEPKVQAAAAGGPDVSKKSKEELARRILMKGVKINYVDEKPPIIHYGQGKEEYFVGVYFNGWDWENQFLGSGRGLSRVEAGQKAAANALQSPVVHQIAAKKAALLAERDKDDAQENGVGK
jgi:ribonuclease III